MTPVATCHCGDARIQLPRTPASAKSCNCSFCDRTGAVWAYFSPEEVQIQAEGARTYSGSDGMNQHHFCGRCGMHVWGDSPDWASVYNADGKPKAGFEPGAMPATRIVGVNLRLVDGLDWSAIEVEAVDGRNNW
jgi:hypothetical protein